LNGPSGTIKHGHQNRDQCRDRPGPEHPGGGCTEHHPFAHEPCQVVVELQHRGSNPAGKEGFGLVDNAKQQRRHRQQQKQVNRNGDQRHGSSRKQQQQDQNSQDVQEIHLNRSALEKPRLTQEHLGGSKGR